MPVWIHHLNIELQQELAKNGRDDTVVSPFITSGVLSWWFLPLLQSQQVLAHSLPAPVPLCRRTPREKEDVEACRFYHFWESS